MDLQKAALGGQVGAGTGESRPRRDRLAKWFEETFCEVTNIGPQYTGDRDSFRGPDYRVSETEDTPKEPTPPSTSPFLERSTSPLPSGRNYPPHTGGSGGRGHEGSSGPRIFRR